jgi:hypothetical protein
MGFLDVVSNNFDCENGLSTQRPAGKVEPSQRRKYALVCSITIALGACAGIIGFFVSENKTSLDDGIISFDLGCIKGHLDAQDGDLADCEVTQNRFQGLGKYMAVPTYAGLSSASTRSVNPQMQFGGWGRKGTASETKPVVGKKARPLSPGSNYPSTKNIQTQSNGFGTWQQRFQKADSKKRYGVAIFDKNGNVNPAYLAAERKEIASAKKRNIVSQASKRKKMMANGEFLLADYISKKIGEVGYQANYNSGN